MVADCGQGLVPRGAWAAYLASMIGIADRPDKQRSIPVVALAEHGNTYPVA